MAEPRILSATIGDEAALARVAAIMGPQSTSQRILDEVARRRADGETVVVYDVVTTSGKLMLVGPPEAADGGAPEARVH